MATSKSVVISATMTIAGTEYGCKSLPAGISTTTDLPDVTVLTDVEQRFAESALVEDKEFTVTLAGDCQGLLNTSGAVVITLSISAAGATATSETLSVGNCICTSVSPASLEAGGDRVLTWDVTLRPDGTRS